MAQRVAIVAALVDIVFMVVFWLLGMRLISLLNLLSVGTYAIAYVLLKRRRNLVAVSLMWAEVMLHTIAARSCSDATQGFITFYLCS